MKLGAVMVTLRNVAWEPISPRPLAVFRIAFSFVLLTEVLHCIYQRDLFFLAHPATESVPNSIELALALWVVSLLCLLFGCFTPVAAVVNYLFVIHFFSPNALFAYHADMLYIPTCFLLIFAPTYRCLSVDRALAKRWLGRDLAAHPVPRIFSNVFIYWVMGFMYFDSTLYKLESPFWIDGLGFWLPASFPSFTTFSWNFILNREWLMKLSGWVTLVFETVFIFIFWIPRVRKYLFVIGLILHFGIAIVLPIPLFGLLMVVLYIHFLPEPDITRWWTTIRRRLGKPATPTPTPTPTSKEAFLKVDRVLGRWVLAMAAVATIVQVTITFGPPLHPSFQHHARVDLGLTEHSVFAGTKFSGMKRDIAIVFYGADGREEWIPCIERDGHVGRQIYGRFWTSWWSHSHPQVRGQRDLWARVAESWAKREKVSLADSRVVVKAKPVLNAHVWEKDRHAAMERLSWSDILTIEWKGGQRTFQNLDSPLAFHDLPSDERGNVDLPLRLAPTHWQMRLHHAIRDGSDSAVATGEPGTVIFGPYIRMAAGRYRARWQGSGIAGSTGDIVFDVAAGGGRVLTSRRHAAATLPTAAAADLVTLDFTLDADTTGIELRVFSSDGARVRLEAIVVDRQ